MKPGAVFVPVVALQTTHSLSSKSLKHLGSVPKTSSRGLSTSRKHTTGFLVKSFGECYVSTVLTAACYWQSSHCIPAQKFVSVSGKLNHDRLPFVLDSDKVCAVAAPFPSLHQWFSTFSLKGAISNLRFCWRASLTFVNTIQFTLFLLYQNEVCYTKY